MEISSTLSIRIRLIFLIVFVLFLFRAYAQEEVATSKPDAHALLIADHSNDPSMGQYIAQPKKEDFDNRAHPSIWP